jgi:hypothetical protein
MRKMKTIRYPITILFMVLLFFTLGSSIYALDIKVKGSWSETIDASDLQAGPGSDLFDTYESVLDEVLITNIDQGPGSVNWRVDVSKLDINWHSNFQLYVRRSSDGNGSGTISGGTSYQEVTDTDQSFFNGSGNRINIGIQLRLSGVSVQVPPDTYTTAVYYTIIQIN